MAVKLYVTLPLCGASLVKRPATPPVALTVKPGNRIEVFPAAAGRLLVNVTVTGWPSVTISVGPGICIDVQFALARFTPPGVGAKPEGVPLHP